MDRFLSNPWKILVGVGIVLGPIYYVNFWSLNLPTNYDSFLYTSIAKYMMDYGQFLTPVGRDGAPLFFKPPATYWQAMVGMAILGQSIFASRIGLIGVHLLSVGLFVLILKKLNVRSSVVAISAFLFGSSFVSFKLTRNLIMENLLELWVLLTLGLLLCSTFRRSRQFVWFSAVLAGVACLIKGFIVPAMYGVILAVFLWTYRRDFQLTMVRAMLWGLCAVSVSGVLGLAWPALMVLKHGLPFWDFYFMGEHLSKLGFTPTHPAGLIPAGLVIYSLPFAHFVVASVLGSALNFNRISKAARFLLLCWMGLAMLFLVPARRDMNYELPFVCVGFLLVGVCWDQVLSWVKKFKLSQGMDILCVGGGAIFLGVAPRLFSVPIGIQIVLIIFVLSFLIYIWKSWRRSIVGHVIGMAVVSCLLWWMILPVVILPEFPAQARPTDPKLPVCVVREYSAYGYYMVLPAFLPNEVHTVFRPEEISNCTEQGYALVFKEVDEDLRRQLVILGYQLSSRWYWIPPGKSPRAFVQAILEADRSKIIQAYVTYVRP